MKNEEASKDQRLKFCFNHADNTTPSMVKKRERINVLGEKVEVWKCPKCGNTEVWKENR
jgi:predicted RNA-binding Zn-ribbon protein involved in translation (DUF1610 family)